MRGFAIATALLALGAAAAPACAGSWAKVSSDYDASTTIPELIQDGSNVLVAWRLDYSTQAAENDAQRFASTVARPYTPSGGRLVSLAGYVTLQNPAVFATPAGVELAVGGTRSIQPGETLSGLLLAGRNPDGSFATPVVAGLPGGELDALALADGTPIMASNESGGIHVLRGTVPTSSGIDLQPALGGCCGYHPALGLDASGRQWIAWYSNATGNVGIYVQQLDPATGGPVGTPAKAPNSQSVYNNSFDTALACAATCRVVYGGGPGAAETQIESWAPGESGPTAIGTVPATAVAGRVVTAAYRSDGRLWVAWWDGSTYRYTLGDATGKGGQVLDATRPEVAAGFNGNAFALSSLAVGNDLVLAANWNGSLAHDGMATFVNRVASATVPPATPAPGPRDVTVTTTPNGKGFRIQVQYRVPASCGKTCKAHAEIRTRSGKRRYRMAAPKLPGDGPVVLGARGTVKLPAGRKVRFFMTVSKAALLKTPFHTEGGFRVAETRLRVWLKTPKGQVLTVRDGRIKVSIARIKSGALPGLRGIL
jgi:hypothetical protein